MAELIELPAGVERIVNATCWEVTTVPIKGNIFNRTLFRATARGYQVLQSSGTEHESVSVNKTHDSLDKFTGPTREIAEDKLRFYIYEVIHKYRKYQEGESGPKTVTYKADEFLHDPPPPPLESD